MKLIIAIILWLMTALTVSAAIVVRPVALSEGEAVRLSCPTILVAARQPNGDALIICQYGVGSTVHPFGGNP